jgi:dipeptidyl aminopeptidase/acylaminoacyl peptidase
MAAVGTAGALAMTGVAAHATVSGPNGKLAFVEPVGNQNRLVVANVDGSGQRVLAGLPAPVSQPRWSPYGSRIAFVAGSYSEAELYVVESDGTDFDTADAQRRPRQIAFMDSGRPRDRVPAQQSDLGNERGRQR